MAMAQLRASAVIKEMQAQMDALAAHGIPKVASSSVVEKTEVTMPKFALTKLSSLPGKSGGLYRLSINGQDICDYTSWAMDSCALAQLHNFKAFQWTTLDKNNFQMLEEHHESLFEWLRNTMAPGDVWKPKEFLMCISAGQQPNMPKLLAHPFVKMIDKFRNKAHGFNWVYLYRISLDKDFSV